MTVLIAVACSGPPSESSQPAPASQAEEIASRLEASRSELSDARAELSQRKAALRATQLDHSARFGSVDRAIDEARTRADVLNGAIEASRQMYGQVLTGADDVASHRECAVALDAALAEAAVDGPFLEASLLEAQRSCDTAVSNG